jgi:hypothetical protein
VSTLWDTRYRLLREQLASLADRLVADTGAPTVAVRLLAACAMLLRQHQVNNRGQCKLCGWSRWRWRFWRRRPPCTVYRSLVFAMSHGLDEVWWQLLESVGYEMSLVDVREWLAQGRSGDPEQDEETVVFGRIET